jgi:hypothetical protein
MKAHRAGMIAQLVMRKKYPLLTPVSDEVIDELTQ